MPKSSDIFTKDYAILNNKPTFYNDNCQSRISETISKRKCSIKNDKLVENPQHLDGIVFD